MSFIDTHAHMYDPAFQADVAKVIEKSFAHHVTQIYMPCIDTHSIEPMIALAQKYPQRCIGMIGLHPCAVKKDFQKQLYHMEAWLAKKDFAAIGEIGIDLYHNAPYQAEQEEAFVIQLGWAKRYGLPIVIHCRKGFEVVIALLEKHGDMSMKGIFHCFGGGLEEARQVIDLGLLLGIGGIVTFKNSGLDEVIRQVDLSHIVLETDSPYLAPTPYRGQRNEPSYIGYVAAKIAMLKQVPDATVGAITSANAGKVLGKDA